MNNNRTFMSFVSCLIPIFRKTNSDIQFVCYIFRGFILKKDQIYDHVHHMYALKRLKNIGYRNTLE